MRTFLILAGLMALMGCSGTDVTKGDPLNVALESSTTLPDDVNEEAHEEPTSTVASTIPPDPAFVPLARVEVGATGDPVVYAPLLASLSAEQVVLATSVESLPIPAGPASAIGYSTSYEMAGPGHVAVESFEFLVETVRTPRQVAEAFATAVSDETGAAFEVTIEQESGAAAVVTMSADRLAYVIDAALRADISGTVVVAVERTSEATGPLPEFSPAAATLAEADATVEGLDYVLEAWCVTWTSDNGSPQPSSTGRIAWSIGAGTGTDLARLEEQLRAVIADPIATQGDENGRYLTLPDGATWNVTFDPARVGAELAASYTLER